MSELRRNQRALILRKAAVFPRQRSQSGVAQLMPVGELAAGLIGADEFSAGIRDLYRTAEPDGTFCYTWRRSSAADAGQSPAN
jgi:hypothetical protein